MAPSSSLKRSSRRFIMTQQDDTMYTPPKKKKKKKTRRVKTDTIDGVDIHSFITQIEMEFFTNLNEFPRKGPFRGFSDSYNKRYDLLKDFFDKNFMKNSSTPSTSANGLVRTSATKTDDHITDASSSRADASHHPPRADRNRQSSTNTESIVTIADDDVDAPAVEMSVNNDSSGPHAVAPLQCVTEPVEVITVDDSDDEVEIIGDPAGPMPLPQRSCICPNCGKTRPTRPTQSESDRRSQVDDRMRNQVTIVIDEEGLSQPEDTPMRREYMPRRPADVIQPEATPEQTVDGPAVQVEDGPAVQVEDVPASQTEDDVLTVQEEDVLPVPAEAARQGQDDVSLVAAAAGVLSPKTVHQPDPPRHVKKMFTLVGQKSSSPPQISPSKPSSHKPIKIPAAVPGSIQLISHGTGKTVFLKVDGAKSKILPHSAENPVIPKVSSRQAPHVTGDARQAALKASCNSPKVSSSFHFIGPVEKNESSSPKPPTIGSPADSFRTEQSSLRKTYSVVIPPKSLSVGSPADPSRTEQSSLRKTYNVVIPPASKHQGASISFQSSPQTIGQPKFSEKANVSDAQLMHMRRVWAATNAKPVLVSDDNLKSSMQKGTPSKPYLVNDMGPVQLRNTIVATPVKVAEKTCEVIRKELSLKSDTVGSRPSEPGRTKHLGLQKTHNLVKPSKHQDTASISFQSLSPKIAHAKFSERIQVLEAHPIHEGTERARNCSSAKRLVCAGDSSRTISNDQAQKTLPVDTMNDQVQKTLPVDTMNDQVQKTLPVDTMNDQVQKTLPVDTMNEVQKTLPVDTMNDQVQKTLPVDTMNDQVQKTLPVDTMNEVQTTLPVDTMNGQVQKTLPIDTMNDQVQKTRPVDTMNEVQTTLPVDTMNGQVQKTLSVDTVNDQVQKTLSVDTMNDQVQKTLPLDTMNDEVQKTLPVDTVGHVQFGNFSVGKRGIKSLNSSVQKTPSKLPAGSRVPKPHTDERVPHVLSLSQIQLKKKTPKMYLVKDSHSASGQWRSLLLSKKVNGSPALQPLTSEAASDGVGRHAIMETTASAPFVIEDVTRSVVNALLDSVCVREQYPPSYQYQYDQKRTSVPCLTVPCGELRCRLGCVCISLSKKSVRRVRCSNVECIFGCSCKSHSIAPTANRHAKTVPNLKKYMGFSRRKQVLTILPDRDTERSAMSSGFSAQTHLKNYLPIQKASTCVQKAIVLGSQGSHASTDHDTQGPGCRATSKPAPNRLQTAQKAPCIVNSSFSDSQESHPTTDRSTQVSGIKHGSGFDNTRVTNGFQPAQKVPGIPITIQGSHPSPDGVHLSGIGSTPRPTYGFQPARTVPSTNGKALQGSRPNLTVPVPQPRGYFGREKIPIPERALMCMTPGLGYVPLVETTPNVILLNPFKPGQKKSFLNVRQATEWLNTNLANSLKTHANLMWVVASKSTLEKKQLHRLSVDAV